MPAPASACAGLVCGRGASHQSNAVQVSKTQSAVMKAVSTTGWRCESEAVVDMYAVDIAIPELKIAVEVDGPSHFTRTEPKRRLGPSAMKMRHLASAGWTVFPILSD